MLNPWTRLALAFGIGVYSTGAVFCQTSSGWSNWEQLVRVPSVSGHEEELAKRIKDQLSDYTTKTDNLGSIIVTIGAGAPHRLLVAPMDQPGYAVSAITEDGFLRVQRLPQAAPSPSFDVLHFAQPVVITTRMGKQVAGVFAGLSVHLQPGRQNSARMNHLDEMYVDVGARNAAEVRAAGIDLLDTVSLDCLDYPLADGKYAGPAIGDHIGVVALVELLQRIRAMKVTVKGTLTVAFVTQSWTGGRGLERVLNEIHPDEMIYVGRLQSTKSSSKEAAKTSQPGGGVLLGVFDDASATRGLPAALAEIAKSQNIPFRTEEVAAPKIGGYVAATPLPARFVQLGARILNPTTPAETISYIDVGGIEWLLLELVAGSANVGVGGVGGTGCGHCGPPLLGVLTETYGPSGHEELVREKVKTLLPEWAKNKVETNGAGNLVLHLGRGKSDAKTQSIAFVAHMDEIGYEVKKIEDDGRLRVDSVGGGYPQYFLGHVVLIHKSDGSTISGVLELPEGWDKANFEWPLSLRGMDEGQHVYIGTKSKEETEKLGIKAGDWMTIPKKYRPLLGTRANARSFDDRVGCAALIEAVRALGPNPDAAVGDRDVTFVWSTQEEVGLKGAAAFAEQAAKDGRVPDFVFAIDTFVSSDSPLEVKRFGDAEIGKGFVIRAVDNSNVVPLEYVDRVINLARENNIPVQYGVTGGGNDGAVFTRYGSVDVALGWPLRYSHSPGEVIDTKDADALAKIVEVIARKW